MTTSTPHGRTPPARIDDETGWRWAACLEQACAFWWMVLWEPAGQHFTGYYRGPWKPGGVYRKGRTPEELWRLIVATQAEGRRIAEESAAPVVPPLLADELPASLWRAAA
ncbi:hypothetical protein [Nonomuraea aridisoli]|uniref:Uncharacterized protein n=1 Tax=Nonomuraea aridisoli TaxID=2070368 RepID=A0A2W2FCK6_9ACTN|nr:hypothetical protein [Nonomuraea aridisoli]PZG22528.1 hypothetical protein C1J01_03840 [Nonomuraea aridisoli]